MERFGISMKFVFLEKHCCSSCFSAFNYMEKRNQGRVWYTRFSKPSEDVVCLSGFYFGKTKFALAITLVLVTIWRKELTMDVLLMTSQQSFCQQLPKVYLNTRILSGTLLRMLEKDIFG